MDLSKKDTQTVRVPFLGNKDQRPTDGPRTGRQFINGYFETLQSPMSGTPDFYFIKRPGLSFRNSPTSGVAKRGRGLYTWPRTGKVYSVFQDKLYSNTTAILTLETTSGLVGFAETRPGATTQYLGINDGVNLYLVGTDDSVLVLNNKVITSSSIANPTVIVATNHGLVTGNKIIIRNHSGSTPNINDTIYTITRLDNNSFTIPVNVTTGGTGGTIGVFPTPTTGDLIYLETYWFVMKTDAAIWNCAVDDPTTWPSAFIFTQMQPGNGVGIAHQNNTLAALTDRHLQLFNVTTNPVGSPLANIEQATQDVGCFSHATIAFQEKTGYFVSNTLTGGLTVYRLDGLTNLKEIGFPSLNRDLTKNYFPVQKTIILTSGTSWTVPSDWNPTNNKIECIGGGGGGGASWWDSGTISLKSGVGGGGGAYAVTTNFDPGGATTIPYIIGAGGTKGTQGADVFTPNAPGNGGDTTFNTSTVIAKGGTGGGNGGQAAACTPSGTAKSGGNGGAAASLSSVGILIPPQTNLVGGSGGGGGAGPFGAGNNGTSGSAETVYPWQQPPGAGGRGDDSVGGLGGTFGQVGKPGTELADGIAGSGGGGSGGGGVSEGPIKAPLGLAGVLGGVYGAGGGSGGVTQVDFGFPMIGPIFAEGAAGTQGLILITYNPSAGDGEAYVLRIGGHTFYVLSLDTVDVTYVYDQQLDIWTEWHAANSDPNVFKRWPIVSIGQHFDLNFLNNTIIGQDKTTGSILNINVDNTQDETIQGSVLSYNVVARTNPLSFGTTRRKFFEKVEILGDATKSSALCTLSYSDNDNMNFGLGSLVSTGRQIQLKGSGSRDENIIATPYSRAWGNSKKRAWQVSYHGDQPIRLSGLEFEITLGT